MFDKLKQLNDLRNMQKTLKEQKIETEHNGVKIVLRGDFEIEHIELNPNLDIDHQERAVLAAFNDAKSKLQRKLVESFAGITH